MSPGSGRTQHRSLTPALGGAKCPGMPYLYAIFVATLFLGVGFALLKGGTPERLVAAIIVAMTIIQPIAHLVIPKQFSNVDIAGVTVDLMAFVGITVIALFADRKWPLWSAALQLLACVAHLVRMISIKVEPLVYATLKATPTVAVICVLIIGTEMHRRRLLRHGVDQSWAKLLPQPFWMRSRDRSSKNL